MRAGTNSCGTMASAAAKLVMCVADFDCTGFLDTDDFTAYVVAFETGC